MSSILATLTKDQKRKYNELVTEAAILRKLDDISKKRQALTLYRNAYSIYTGDHKLKERITALEVAILSFNFYYFTNFHSEPFRERQ